jgi:hypothetical protein
MNFVKELKIGDAIICTKNVDFPPWNKGGLPQCCQKGNISTLINITKTVDHSDIYSLFLLCKNKPFIVTLTIEECSKHFKKTETNRHA